jgi:hypothetical protein
LEDAVEQFIQYGIIGSTTHTGIEISYLRHFALNGIDLEKYRVTGKTQELWLITATSSGASGDLRKAFPYLLFAAKKYIASNTGEKIKVVVNEDDENVLEMKNKR